MKVATKKGFEPRKIDLSLKHMGFLKTMDGSYSFHIEQALEMYLSHIYSVYKITDKGSGKFFIDFYNITGDVQDLYWHYVNTRGSESLGRSIRDKGLDRFDFTVVCRCADIEQAELLRALLRKIYSKKYDMFEF